MRLFRLLVATLSLAGWALCASPADAALTGTISPLGSPVWESRPATGGEELNEVNRQDCLDPDAKVTFNINVTGFDTANLFEVWSGSNCTTKTNRDDNTACIKVASGKPESQLVKVSVKDMLQKEQTQGAGIGTGTDETCNQGASSGATKRTLYFMILDQNALDAAPAVQPWEFTYDLTAPAAPAGITAGAGEQSLVVSLGTSTDDDVAHYQFYCAADEGACTSSLLTPGTDVPTPLPAGVTKCGETNALASSEGNATGLANGASYAVAAVAKDELGNLSPLSEIACGTPKEVTGFYEAYRAAGGQGGGGFCSFGPARRGGVTLALALALGAAALLRRRR